MATPSAVSGHAQASCWAGGAAILLALAALGLDQPVLIFAALALALMGAVLAIVGWNDVARRSGVVHGRGRATVGFLAAILTVVGSFTMATG